MQRRAVRRETVEVTMGGGGCCCCVPGGTEDKTNTAARPVGAPARFRKGYLHNMDLNLSFQPS
jgi:hypothetical protein